MKVGDLVVYKRSFYERYGFSTETVLGTVGYGIIQKSKTDLIECDSFYVVWSKGHGCWEYSDELEVVSESR